MPRQSLDPEIVSLIEEKWVHMKEPSAAEVHRAILRKEGNVVGVRKVQQVIADLKTRRVNKVSNVEIPWEPWQLESETAEEIDYLLELRRLGEISGTPPLSTTQAEWAKKIRVSMKDMKHLMVPFLVSAIYAGRQTFSTLTARPETFYSDDLDQYLAYKPWVSESRRDSYEKGLDSGKIKYPLAFFLGNAFEKLPFESRLGIVKKFGLPEGLARMTLEDVRAEWRLFGPKEFTPYVNSLINSSEQQIQDAEADK